MEEKVMIKIYSLKMFTQMQKNHQVGTSEKYLIQLKALQRRPDLCV